MARDADWAVSGWRHEVDERQVRAAISRVTDFVMHDYDGEYRLLLLGLTDDELELEIVVRTFARPTQIIHAMPVRIETLRRFFPNRLRGER